MKRRGVWPLLLACTCAISCADSAENAAPGPAVQNSGSVELGQGELEFSPLNDDEALPYAAGSQGGHHVFVSFRVQQLQPSRMHVAVTTAIEGQPDRTLTREGRVNFVAVQNEDNEAVPTFEFSGWPAQILFAPCHVGEAARIDVTLTDRDMRAASDSRTIRIAMPSGAPEPTCPAR